MPAETHGPRESCPDCGASVPAWAPGGNCPVCLLNGGAGFSPGVEENSGPGASEKVGDWELRERIGEGAFGVVFAAEQGRPVQRTAALKILRPGMASKEVLARFEAESQALALMNHPDVVTIFDAGTTDDGRPFIAMEFVPGLRVNRFAAELSLGEKLDLFDRICAVVEHAHQRGIIHRDLKPDNILVYRDENDQPILKLLDFGIAKATEQVLTEATVLTGKGHFLGTPEYMSPEQTMDTDIDTRADLYSLGVILFELLAGRPPFTLDSNSVDAVIRFLERVREEAAPTPSSAAEGGEIVADLDWIVGKAIEKDRGRRYRSVAELREDLRRFRNSEPIRARPPDTFYIVAKFLRRNWKLTAVLGAIALTITGAAIVSALMAVRANQATLETRTAYSESDQLLAVEEIGRGEIAAGISRLVRSLRTAPRNRDAALMLRSTIDQFPISELIYQKTIATENLKAAFFAGSTADPERLIAVTEFGTVHFLDGGGTPLSPPLELGGTQQKANIDREGRRLAVTDVQGRIHLIDLENFAKIELEDAEDEFGSQYVDIVFSPRLEYLCVTRSDGTVRVWDPKTGRLKWRKTLASPPQSAVFFNNGAHLAMGCRNGDLLELVSFSGEPAGEPRQLSEPVQKIFPSVTGYRYYAISPSGVLTGIDKGKPPHPYRDKQVGVPVLRSLVDRERKHRFYLSADEVSLWSSPGKTVVRRMALSDPPTCLATHPRANLLFIGTANEGIRLWDFAANRIAGTELIRAKNSEAIRVDADSGLLRCVRRDGVLQHYRLPEGLTRSRDSELEPDQKAADWDALALENRNDHLIRSGLPDFGSFRDFPKIPPRSAASSPDGSRLFAAYGDERIRGWDIRTGDMICRIPTTTNAIRSIDVSTDGKTLLYCDKYRSVTLFDLETEEKQVFGVRHQRGVSGVAFSPLGDAFATASDDGTARVWSVESGRPKTGPLRHDPRGTILAHYCRFSADGTWLVTWGTSDGTFRIWEAGSGAPVGTLAVDRGVPRYAHLFPGREYLATIVENPDRRRALRTWAIDSAIPVTPERWIATGEFSLARLAAPRANSFTPDELDRIERFNGLRAGETGLIEIPYMGE